MAIGRSTIVLIASLTSAAACDPGADSGETIAPVVVFAGVVDSESLRSLQDAFTPETGVAGVLRQGDPWSIVDDVIAHSTRPPAASGGPRVDWSVAAA